MATLTLTTGWGFERVQFNHPGLTVDLGVGLWAWPLPMDWDDDGDYDLVVSCPDVPYNGTYFFENSEGDVKLPLFKPGVKVGKGIKNVQVSHVDGVPHVLQANEEFVGFRGKSFEKTRTVHPSARIHQAKGNMRFNVWSYVDYDGDGVHDVLVGADDWGYYGWDDGYDSEGRWKRGPLHGYVYLLRNAGSTAEPNYGAPFRVQAGGKDVNVYGNPQPNLADFDGDGDLDLICGEFLDGFSYFENTGSRTKPVFAGARRLTDDGTRKIAMHVQMITPSAIDWDKDGDVDLVCGDEDGRVALIENTSEVRDGLPLFKQPVYFQQQARDLKFGALVTPVSYDWDADGDEDLICGNTAGDIGFIENLDGGNPPRWARPALLQANGKPIRLQAGEQGSIQGPAEAKWGYTTLSVADWNHDGLPDIVVNSIWGRVEWFENAGSRSAPALKDASPVRVAWTGEAPKPKWTWWEPDKGTLATQWRTTPVVVDWDQDGLNDLVMLDHEGYLALFQRRKAGEELVLLPGKRLFREGETPLQLNAGSNGKSGRRKLCVVDWDGDGKRDLLVNGKSADWWRNTSNDDGDTVTLTNMGTLHDQRLAGHTTSPTTVDWDGDGVRDLLLGAEDGRFYYLKNTHSPQSK